MRVAARTVAVELLPPFHHVALAAVFLDELGDAVAPLASALGAFDAQRIELVLDVAEDEVGVRHRSAYESRARQLTGQRGRFRTASFNSRLQSRRLRGHRSRHRRPRPPSRRDIRCARCRGQPEGFVLTIQSWKKMAGDGVETATVRRAPSGVDVVIQSLGVSAGPEIIFKPMRDFSKATRVLVTAMEQAHVKRLICVTGFGAGDSLLYNAAVHLLLGRVYDDKDVQERSKLGWVIVRPAGRASPHDCSTRGNSAAASDSWTGDWLNGGRKIDRKSTR